MRFYLLFMGQFMALLAFTQESPFIKFGKITAADLERKVYSIDSSAAAVVLSDVGEAYIGGNSKGWFSLYTTRHKVVHILKKSAYDEAVQEIFLYVNGTDEEKVEELKAVTYNLEAGKVVESKMERSSVFTEKKSANRIIKKFTVPNVKEGSIIEFQYKVSSDFISHVDPWHFQGQYPRLWSEFLFTVPQFFSYTHIGQGYLKSFLSDKKERSELFTVRDASTATATETFKFTSNVTTHRWVMKDVPELKPESYITTAENHVSKMEFQLVSQNDPLTPRDYRNSWPSFIKELRESDRFGNGIKGVNSWLSDDLKPVLTGAQTQKEKAKKIYDYVRDGYSCTSYAALYAEQSVKAVFKAHKGTVAEINLLLVAMLRNAGINAHPVILSQSERGYVYDLFPVTSRFNYVIVRAEIDGKNVYLDATHSRLGFGQLLPGCYNGHARLVDEEATPVYLFADSLQERSMTAVFLRKGDKEMWEGSVNDAPGTYQSYKIRSRIADKGKDDFFAGLQKEKDAAVVLKEYHIDSLNQYEEPLRLRYTFSYTPENEDILYINPMFGEGYTKNPFKSAERFYPVEMPYASDQTYVFSMEVPEGYVVDELPKSIVAKYDEEGKTFMEYRIQQSGGTISMRSRVRLARAYYEPEEYEILREFFTMIVKKHAEQIVLKKKKNA